MKILRNIAILLILVVVAVLAAVIFYGGALIKQGVEKVGPSVLGVPVTLESAHFYPLRGKAGLQGLNISNPEGFKSAHLMKLDSISVSIDMASLKTDTVIIDEIVIEKPDISYEMSLKGNNFKALMENLAKKEGQEPVEEEPIEEAPAEEPGKAGKKVVIKYLVINGGVVRVSSRTLAGLGTPIPLSKIEMRDIGAEETGGDEGATLTQVITKIFSTILRSVGSVATGTVDLAGKGVKAAGKGAVAVGGAAVDGATAVGGAAVDGTKAVGGAAVSGTKAVGGFAVDGTKAVGGAAVSGTKAVGGAAVDGTKAVGGAAVSGTKAVGGAAVDGTKAVGGAAVSGTKAVGGAIGSGAGAIGKGLGGLVGMGDEKDAPEDPQATEVTEDTPPEE